MLAGFKEAEIPLSDTPLLILLLSSATVNDPSSGPMGSEESCTGDATPLDGSYLLFSLPTSSFPFFFFPLAGASPPWFPSHPLLPYAWWKALFTRLILASLSPELLLLCVLRKWSTLDPLSLLYLSDPPYSLGLALPVFENYCVVRELELILNFSFVILKPVDRVAWPPRLLPTILASPK